MFHASQVVFIAISTPEKVELGNKVPIHLYQKTIIDQLNISKIENK